MLKFPSEEKESWGLVECLIATGIFFSPNLLIFIPVFRETYFIFLIYNYVIVFSLISAITNIKFNKK